MAQYLPKLFFLHLSQCPAGGGVANNTGTNQPAHARSLISTFVIRFLESIICMLQVNFNFVANLCSGGDWFETRFVGNPEDRFSHHKAHL